MIIILKKKIFFPVLALAIIGTAVATSTIASAQDNTGINSLVTAIAQKFNLNENDVQAVFSEHKLKRQAQIEANIEQKLTSAVSSGRITGTQKQAILAKLQEIKNNHPDKQAFKSMTKDERKAFMQQKKTDIENWAKANGLTLQTLQEVVGGPFGSVRKMIKY